MEDPALLAASVAECTQQLKSHLFRPIWSFFKNVFLVSRSRNDKRDVFAHFVAQMQKVPDWNQRRLCKITDELLAAVCSKGFDLQKCVHGIVVDRTVLMTARYHGAVKVVVPDKYSFIHALLCVLAADLAEYPQWVQQSQGPPSEIQQQRVMAMDWFNLGIETVLTDYVGSREAFDSMHVNHSFASKSQDGKEEEPEEEEEEVVVPADRGDDDDDDDEIAAAAIAAEVEEGGF